MTGAPSTSSASELIPSIYAELAAALGGIRQGRDALMRVDRERIAKGHRTLSEVSSVTESAATEMLDGLDRSLAQIDRLASEVGHQPTPAAILNELRDGTMALFGLLQFQDITAQQLAGVACMLDDIEARIVTVVGLLGGIPTPAGITVRPATDRSAFNEDASFQSVAERQADIDRAFEQGSRGQVRS